MDLALRLKLALAALLLLAVAALITLGHDVKAYIQHGLALLRTTGPVLFFLAMALLPAVGAPLSFFCLTAGSVFGPQLGMPVVILLCLTAIAANIALSYVLANRVLRPPLQYVLGRLGYQVPQVATGDVTDLIVLLRVMPGLPFAVQNYLLGLASVPFLRYLMISCLIAFPLNAAVIFFGKALLQGRDRMALVGLLLLLALMAALHLVRRRLRERSEAGD